MNHSSHLDHLDLNNLDKLSYVYHYVTNYDNIKILKKIGICSPFYLKNHNLKIFMKTSYRIYKTRTMKYLRKLQITPDDIITYLNNKPNELQNSKTIYFLLLPIKNYSEDIQKSFYFHNKIECKIPIKYLKDKELITLFKGKITKSNWNKIISKKFLNNIIIPESKNKPGKFVFSNITHIGVNIEKIPPNHFKITNFN